MKSETSGIDECRLAELLGGMREGFQVIGRDWRYLYVNDTVCKQARKTREQLVGRTMMECFPGIDQAPFFAVLRQVMEDGIARDFENEFVHEGGDREWFELRIEPASEGATVLSLDVTARKRLEATLRQAQKMDAVGKLAGGVAHDFNNLLTVITSFATFARDGFPLQSPGIKDLDEVLAAADRATKLTKQLLSFSRQGPHQPREASVNTIVRELQPMIERLFGGAGIRARLELAPSLRSVRLDVNALEQVLVNLAVNARDAMPDGGEVVFETRDLELLDGRGNIPPGAWVAIRVSDTGTGMTREVQERLFEPFFTTKPEGKGTGLGLATSYAIVRQAGGFIGVTSEPGRGSTFEVCLPRA